jgi:hypothetical protein
MTRTITGLAVALLLSAGACGPDQPAVVHESSAPVHTFAGGCGGTVLTDSEPPVWAQGGWNVVKGQPWSVPWALGSGGQAVAFLFAIELVAGTSPRVDGTNNKVLWVAKGSPPNFAVAGTPMGATEPAVSVNGGPSIVDVPASGCWTFRLSWGLDRSTGSTINLDVLPAGSTPPVPAAA